MNISGFRRWVVFWVACLSSTLAIAAPTSDLPVYTFGIVPQQSATKMASDWGPMLARVGAAAGVRLEFKTDPNIPAFENQLRHGAYDCAYMNPYHYIVFHQQAGYEAIAHSRDRKIQGVIVVKKDSTISDIQDLSGRVIAFPAPAAFAATILVQAELKKQHISFTPKYVNSHDSVYLNVAQGLIPAGAGINRTLAALDPAVANQLKVLWKTQTYTPHAIACLPRVPSEIRDRIQAAFIALNQTPEGRELLANLNIPGWQAASDADWDDVRALNIHTLDPLSQ